VKSLALVVAAIALTGATSAAAATPADDAKALVTAVERDHPDPWRAVSRAAFLAAADSVARARGRDEAIVALMKLAALLGPRNGHTGIFPGDPGDERPLHLYPLRLWWTPEGLIVLGAQDRRLVGARLVAVEGRAIADVVRAIEPLVPRDNDETVRENLPGYLLTAEVLRGLRLAPTDATFTFRSARGTRRVKLRPLVPSLQELAVGGWYTPPIPQTLPRTRQPSWLRDPERELSVTTIAGGRAIYARYTAVTVATDAAAARIRALARSRRVTRVVVDLRLNGGGDNQTYGPLLAALVAVAETKKLEVLIGRMTFSAAENFATDLERQARPVFLGEPSGGSPNLYGDSEPVSLPATGVVVRVATIYWQKSTADDPRLAIEPTVPVALHAADLLLGRDPVLAAALRLR
jgi:hypothetical protein